MPVPKPPSQFRLKSALNLAKTNPIPLEKEPMAKSRGSALKGIPKLKAAKTPYSPQNNFKK